MLIESSKHKSDLAQASVTKKKKVFWKISPIYNHQIPARFSWLFFMKPRIQTALFSNDVGLMVPYCSL